MTDDARALRDRLLDDARLLDIIADGADYRSGTDVTPTPRSKKLREMATDAREAAARLGAPETPARYALAEIVQQCAACGRNRSLSSWAAACECGSRHAVISYVPPRPEPPAASPVSPGAPETPALHPVDRAVAQTFDEHSDPRAMLAFIRLLASTNRPAAPAVSGGTEP